MTFQDILDTFAVLDDWEARYEFISELEGKLHPLLPHEQVDYNLVPGCNTRTWLTGSLIATQPPRIEYRADAETPLVRGLVALLLTPFQDQTPAAVLAIDAMALLGQTGLDTHLSPNRQAGMAHFIERVYQIARELQSVTP